MLQLYEGLDEKDIQKIIVTVEDEDFGLQWLRIADQILGTLDTVC